MRPWEMILKDHTFKLKMKDLTKHFWRIFFLIVFYYMWYIHECVLTKKLYEKDKNIFFNLLRILFVVAMLKLFIRFKPLMKGKVPIWTKNQNRKKKYWKWATRTLCWNIATIYF